MKSGSEEKALPSRVIQKLLHRDGSLDRRGSQSTLENLSNTPICEYKPQGCSCPKQNSTFGVEAVVQEGNDMMQEADHLPLSP